MAYVTRRVSDLSGVEGAESDFATLTVRRYPGLEKPAQFDVTPDEIKGLKDNDTIVIVEVKRPGSNDTEMVHMLRDDFDALAPKDNMAELLGQARGTRGRRPGSRVNGG
ncbi:hypothetical protein [Streptomyces geranii]|uniref:hypothetical protein n=1 Tax=Streptomyces geranii TaxID=2058923 RepID=UPI001300ACCA|nr:hypothetical protein [Streptomyces geranii]